MTKALEVVTTLNMGVIASSNKHTTKNTLTSAVMAITGLIMGMMETVIALAHKNTTHTHGHSRTGSQSVVTGVTIPVIVSSYITHT